jgi:hypothetical protein
MQDEITKVVKNTKGAYAVFVGKKDSDGNVHIGWSKCDKTQDKFDKDEGLRIARARLNANVMPPLPRCLGKKARQFKSRCVRYFKPSNNSDVQALCYQWVDKTGHVVTTTGIHESAREQLNM